ncbi:MAG: hypothetical protein J7L63_04515 [Thermoplasmata archaeon]|nr:hypothetical protein [Thermoplasmata archaeon]
MEFKETVIWNDTEYGLYEVEIIPVEISANTFSAVINFTYHGDVGEIRKVQVSYRNNYLPKRINNSLDSYPYISPVRNIWNADWLTSLDGKRVNGSYKIAPNGDAVIYSINDSVREVKISTYIHNSVVYSSQPWFPFPVKVDGYIFTPGRRILDFSILLNFTLPFAAGHGGTQAPGLPTPMVNLTVDGLTVTLKIVPPYNYTHYYIFWGDNTYEVTTALNLKHHYKVVGNYTVAIFYVYNGTGVVPYFLDTWGQFKFNGWEQSHIWLKEVSLK